METATSIALQGLPEDGQLVLVRRRPFVVLNVKGSGVPSDNTAVPSAPSQHLVTLSSVEDDALGEELQVVWELEPGAQVHERMGLPDPSGFDDPRRFDAFLNAVRWGAVSNADVSALQAPFRSGIAIEDYQLDPVVRALQMPRVNLLIADDVGLGKTIETGLVAQELILRHRVRTILVVCPSALQIQWRDQMRDKFGLEFRIVDSQLMRDLRRRRGLHVNPWKHFPRLITSMDFLKRDTPMRLFRETLPAEGQPAFPRRYDMLIVDEAHNAAPSGRQYYAVDSLRTQTLRAIVPHFEHKMFLTATPHNGYVESFTSLLELLDNQRFARGVRPNRAQLEAVMVRRMKSDLKLRWDGSRRFAERQVHAIEVPYTDAERHVHQALKEYSASRLEHARDATERCAAEFVLKLLKKRLFSSPAAFASTLEKHQQSLLGSRRSQAASALKPARSVLLRHIDESEEEHADDDEHENAGAEAVQTATTLFQDLTPRERALLGELKQYAGAASARADSKARALLDWLKATVKPDGRWSSQRVLIFTEYRTTQKWLQTLLASEGLAEPGRLLVLYGGMLPEDRETIKAAFQASPRISPVRILLATDAASEGIDLQNHCSRVIHIEIPWNPNRLEQRNGRLDRHGQKAPQVDVYHFVARGYSTAAPGTHRSDLEADLEFLMRAVEKIEAIREDIGKVGPVIAQQVEEAMLGRRRTLETSQAEKDSEVVKSMLRFERRLREQLEKMHAQLTDSRRELHITPETVRDVVRYGLELAGQPPLREAEAPGIWPDPEKKLTACPVFHLPALAGSWALCTEGLAHPHTGEIRPIVFDHALAEGRDDVVLAHLNHRLVQMCLRLLRAEVWSAGDSRKLSRITVRVVDDNLLQTPAVFAYGRLVVLGGDNQRLHEEVISAAGTIEEGKLARLTLARMNDIMKAIAAADEPRDVSDAMKQKFRTLWPRLAPDLLKLLNTRMIECTRGLQTSLDERAEKETKDIRSVMEELARTIREQINAPELSQLEFWPSQEREQLESNLAALRRRLQQIPQEIVSETAAIKARYRAPQPRAFPVAVMFCVPRRLANV